MSSNMNLLHKSSAFFFLEKKRCMFQRFLFCGGPDVSCVLACCKTLLGLLPGVISVWQMVINRVVLNLLIVLHQMVSSNLKCVCVCVSLVPLQRHKQPARQCQTASLYPPSMPASCLQTGWKLITLPSDTPPLPHTAAQHCSPGYGTLPLVTSSVSKIPKDQTSDLMVKRPYRAASGAVHLMGNLAPVRGEDSCEVEPQEGARPLLSILSSLFLLLLFLLQDTTKAVMTQNDVTEITFFGNQVQTRLKMDPGEISKFWIKGTNWD